MSADEHRLSSLSGPDLTGCRHRLVRKLRGDVPPERTDPAVIERRREADAHRQMFLEHAIAIAGPGRLSVIDPTGDDADLETLEALARGDDLITGAVLHHDPRDGRMPETAYPDLLIRFGGPSSYLPVALAPHAKLDVRRGGPVAARVLPVDPLLSAVADGRLKDTGAKPMAVDDPARKLRHHHPDAVTVGQSAALLHRVGASCGFVGGLGTDLTSIVIADEGPRVAAYRNELLAGRSISQQVETVRNAAITDLDTLAVAGSWPLVPRRSRECKACRWWTFCGPELELADDISLLIPGQQADSLRDAGITTVHGLARSDEAGERAWLARAQVAGIPAFRKVAATSAPRADVEVDVDMEAYPGAGCYLWGARTNGSYTPFVTWADPGPDGLGGTSEGANFTMFWHWLMDQRRAAHESGRTFAAYCWSAEAENHWMRFSAKRFTGTLYDIPFLPSVDSEVGDGSVGKHALMAPTPEEVDAFLKSDEWVDMFRVVRTQLLAPGGLKLKQVAPWAGFDWRDEEAAGLGSVIMHRSAVDSAEPESLRNDTRATLLRYNSDDCEAMAWIRDWLDGPANALPHGTQLPRP